MESAMQFMTALLGGTDHTILNSAFALGIVIVMIVLGVWALKLFTRAGTTMTRGRNRRLTVVDTAMVDGKRQIIIIRRDNVEHLIMTGGPQDLVIESGIAPPEPLPAQRRGTPRNPAPSPMRPADIATPITPDRPVSRDTVDRLNDLARPAPLPPQASLRHTALLRPLASEVIPMGPELRIDNSTGDPADSAKTAAVVGTGQARVGRNRFFRGAIRSDRT